LSLNLEDGKKNFLLFQLNNAVISELPENVFEDITLNNISIENAYKLSRIHTHAFTATNYYLTFFEINNTPLNNFLPYLQLSV
jgi:hypothetical protein